MQTSKTFLEWTKYRFEEIARAQVWAVLRTIDTDLLKRAGIEPELLEKGPNAWPWRAVNHENRPRPEFPIDERGAPIPIGSADELDRLGARKPSRRLDPDSTHLAA